MKLQDDNNNSRKIFSSINFLKWENSLVKSSTENLYLFKCIKKSNHILYGVRGMTSVSSNIWYIPACTTATDIKKPMAGPTWLRYV